MGDYLVYLVVQQLSERKSFNAVTLSLVESVLLRILVILQEDLDLFIHL